MRLCCEIAIEPEPMLFRRARNTCVGDHPVSHLKLRFDDAKDDSIPFPGRSLKGPSRWRDESAEGSRRFDPGISATEETLDRMARQLANLRELMGTNDQPGGPRAA